MLLKVGICLLDLRTLVSYPNKMGLEAGHYRDIQPMVSFKNRSKGSWEHWERSV